jgi:hypothetical protein
MVNLIEYLNSKKYKLNLLKKRKKNWLVFSKNRKKNITFASICKLTFVFAKPEACECYVLLFQPSVIYIEIIYKKR